MSDTMYQQKPTEERILLEMSSVIENAPYTVVGDSYRGVVGHCGGHSSCGHSSSASSVHIPFSGSSKSK